MNLNEQINRPLDWDVKVYLLRRVSPLKWKPVLISSYAMFNTSAVEMQRISNAYNHTTNYIFEYKRIKEYETDK